MTIRYNEQDWEYHSQIIISFYDEDTDDLIGSLKLITQEGFMIVFEGFYIQHNYRGKGYARQMMEVALNYYEPYEMCLQIHSGAWVQNFYESYGFILDETIINKDPRYKWMIKRK